MTELLYMFGQTVLHLFQHVRNILCHRYVYLKSHINVTCNCAKKKSFNLNDHIRPYPIVFGPYPLIRSLGLYVDISPLLPQATKWWLPSLAMTPKWRLTKDNVFNKNSAGLQMCKRSGLAGARHKDIWIRFRHKIKMVRFSKKVVLWLKITASIKLRDLT